MNLLSMIPYEKRSKVTIYVARVNLQNKIMPSAPCATCRSNLILAGIKYVVYYDGKEIRKEKPADARS
jgi:deoxycytidylate deaminase